MKLFSIAALCAFAFFAAAVSQPKTGDLANPNFIRYVDSYPHGLVPIATKNGCAVYVVDGGQRWLRVCDYRQALFKADDR